MKNNKPKFRKGEVAKHVLGEKLIIIYPCNMYGGKLGYDQFGSNDYNTFGEFYRCKRSDFSFVDVHEYELKKIS
jgi:hypothetical protein